MIFQYEIKLNIIYYLIFQIRILNEFLWEFIFIEYIRSARIYVKLVSHPTEKDKNMLRIYIIIEIRLVKKMS